MAINYSPSGTASLDDFKAAIEAEIGVVAAAGDAALQTQINTQADARFAGDAALQTQITANDADIANLFGIAIHVDDRPGDNFGRFSATQAGDGDDRTPLGSGSVVTNDLGKVYSLTGAGYVLRRDPVAISRDVWEIMVRVRRETDPADPSNHTVRMVAVWLNSAKQVISETALVQDTSLIASDGLVEMSARVSALAVSGVTAPPSGAVYMTVGVRQFGDDGTLSVETVRAREVTDLHGLSEFDLSAIVADAEAATTAAESAVASLDQVTVDSWADVALTDLSGVTTDTTSAALAPMVLRDSTGARFKWTRHVLGTFADLDDLTYEQVAEGAVLRLLDERASYKVLASGASPSDIQSLSTPAVHLDVLPSPNGWDVTAFGARGDGVADDTAAINKAIAKALSQNTSEVFFPDGTYRVTDTIGPVSEKFGLRLIGSGMHTTSILGDFTNGPVVRLSRSLSMVRDMTINASVMRKTTGAASDHGLLIEPPDTPTGAVSLIRADHVRIINQPGDGLKCISLNIGSMFAQVLCQENAGHGFNFTGGAETGRTNTLYPGLFTMHNCWAIKNAGHGLKLGDPSDNLVDLPVRVVLQNFETSDNALTTGTRISEDEIWVRGWNITFETCAIGGDEPSTNGGIRFAGEGLQIRNHRTVKRPVTLRLEKDHRLDRTYNILIDGLRITNVANDPVVVVTPDAGSTDYCHGVQVKTYGQTSRITRMFTPGIANATWEKRGSPVRNVVKRSTQTVNNTDSFTDIEGLQIWMDSGEKAPFEAMVRYSGDPAANIKFTCVGPAGMAIRWDNAGSTYISGAGTVLVSNSEIIEGAARVLGVSATGTRTAYFRGVITNGTTPGYFRMQFAQSTATAVNTRVLENSYLRLIDENAGDI